MKLPLLLIGVVLWLPTCGATTTEDVREALASTPQAASSPAAVQTPLPRLRIGLPRLEAEDGFDAQISERLRSFLIDIWSRWGQQQGYRVEFTPFTNWQGPQLLAQDKLDVVALTSYQPALSDTTLFSLPYIELNANLYRRTGGAQKPLTIAYHAPDEMNMVLQPPADARIIRNGSLQQLLDKPQRFDYPYSWQDEPSVMTALAQHGLAGQYQRINGTVPALSLRAAVSRQRPELAMTINQGLRIMAPALIAQDWRDNQLDQQTVVHSLLEELIPQLDDEQERFYSPTPWPPSPSAKAPIPHTRSSGSYGSKGLPSTNYA